MARFGIGNNVWEEDIRGGEVPDGIPVPPDEEEMIGRVLEGIEAIHEKQRSLVKRLEHVEAQLGIWYMEE